MFPLLSIGLSLVAGCSDQVIAKRQYAPEVAILSPLDGQRAWRDAETLVYAQVEDPYNDDLTTVDVRWETDNGTVVADGWSEPTVARGIWTPVRDGAARLSVLVVDPDSEEARDQVDLQVVANQRPVVELLAPEDGEVLRQDRSATLRANAYDDGGENFLTVGWTLDGDVLDGCDASTPDGQILCSLGGWPLSGEDLELCVYATDELGVQGVACHAVDVVACVDDDGDGVSTCDDDCDDADPSRGAGLPEVCDGVDNDCDGDVDEGAGDTYYADVDGDGYGDASRSMSSCSAPSGYVADATDCDDGASDVHPGAIEVCDGLDNDCDGVTDEDAGATYYADADGDRYGDASRSVTACSAPSGYVSDSADCDDSLATVSPGASEICDGLDNDCDTAVDEGVTGSYYADADGDRYGDASRRVAACSAPSGYVADRTDCDDSLATVSPGASEVCDGLDNDCDAAVDEGVTGTFYADADGDRYGDASRSTSACSAPSGFVADRTDCDDGRSSVYPGASEVCDGLDNDCDGTVDEGALSVFYADGDGDRYGDASRSTAACAAPSGYVADGTDCDDVRSGVNPGATEVCDGRDNDCDSATDEGVTTTYYADGDGDRYGDASRSTAACSAPSGYVADATDCDDVRSGVNPGATEVCDGRDDDCDGATDEGVTTTYYADGDGDRYGDASRSAAACAAPSGYVADATDCDDVRSGVNPGATEVCDGLDNDCDRSTDEGVTLDWFVDADGDTYGDPAVSTSSCTAPSGYVADDTDCDDTDPAVHPGVTTDVTDGVDADCDGEDAPCGSATRYVPDEFATIQAAVDASCDGDRIEVSAGTYPEDVTTRGKALTILGVDGPTVTSIVGSGTRSVLSTSAPIWLEGFTITGGSANSGGGVYAVTASGDLTFVDLVVESNEATSVGGGVYAVTSGAAATIIVEGCSFLDNTVGSSGGGAYLYGADVVVQDSVANFNVGVLGAGFMLYAPTSLLVEDTVANDNVSDSTGGGFYISASGTTTLRRVEASRNLRPYGGGFGSGIMLGSTGATVTLEDITVVDNYQGSGGFGGGIYIGGSSRTRGTWVGGTISGNSAAFGSGFFLQEGTWSLSEVDVRENTSGSTLGSVWVNEAASLSLTNVVVAGNNAGVNVGGGSAAGASLRLTNVDLVGNGGAGVVCQFSGRLTMVNTTSAYNSGTGISASSCASLSVTYGDLYGNAGGAVSGMTDPTGTSGNIAVIPGYVSYVPAVGALSWDLTLSTGSALVDAGSTALLDPDGSRSAIGAYGGPGGAW